jgi:hypothetical protein
VIWRGAVWSSWTGRTDSTTAVLPHAAGKLGYRELRSYGRHAWTGCCLASASLGSSSGASSAPAAVVTLTDESYLGRYSVRFYDSGTPRSYSGRYSRQSRRTPGS